MIIMAVFYCFWGTHVGCVIPLFGYVDCTALHIISHSLYADVIVGNIALYVCVVLVIYSWFYDSWFCFWSTGIHACPGTQTCSFWSANIITIIIIIIIIIFYSPAQHKTNKDNNGWIQEYAERLPEKQKRSLNWPPILLYNCDAITQLAN